MKFESSEVVPEKIATAAIRMDDRIFTGENHMAAIAKMKKEYPNWEEDENLKLEDGFLTNKGRFVERDEAGLIAKQAGQLEHLELERKQEAENKLDSLHFIHDTDLSGN